MPPQPKVKDKDGAYEPVADVSRIQAPTRSLRPRQVYEPREPYEDTRSLGEVLQELFTQWSNCHASSRQSLREQWRVLVRKFVYSKGAVSDSDAEGTELFAPWAMVTVPRRILHDCLDAEFDTRPESIRLGWRRTSFKLGEMISRLWPAPIRPKSAGQSAAYTVFEGDESKRVNYMLLFFGIHRLSKNKRFWDDWKTVTADNFLHQYRFMMRNAAKRCMKVSASAIVCCLNTAGRADHSRYLVEIKARDLRGGSYHHPRFCCILD